MPQHQRPTFSSASSGGASSEGASSEGASSEGPSSEGAWRGAVGRLWRGLRAALPDRPLRATFVAGIALVALALSLLWLAGSTRPERGSRMAVADSSQKREKQEEHDSTQAQPMEKERSREAPKAAEEESREEPSARSSSESSPSESSQNESSSESSSDETSSDESSGGASGERTYSFAGSVSKDIPEVESRPNASGGESGSSSSPSQGGEPGKGDSRSQQNGTVPELTIQVTEDNIAAVADRFDYQMAAITGLGDAILGAVEGGTLRALSEGELSRYAGRARSARRHPKYQDLLRQVARQVPNQQVSGQGADSIRLIYLVPKAVEKRLVKAQMQALKRRGLSPDEVAKMEARPKGQSIEITGITRK